MSPCNAKVMTGSYKNVLLFTEHVEENVDVDGEEYEKIETFSAILPHHP